MQIFSVGKNTCDIYDLEIFESNHPSLQWFVYDYEQSNWEGFGYGISLDEKQTITIFTLNHCSCYGPLDGPELMDSYSKQEFYEYLKSRDSVHDITLSDKLLSKVNELLATLE